jgi:hypothetical protein
MADLDADPLWPEVMPRRRSCICIATARRLRASCRLGGAFDEQGSGELIILSLSLTTERIIGCHAVATLNLHIVSNAE